MASRLERLYDEDFHAWTREQAKALCYLAETRPDDEIDFRHLVEEVRDLGKSERVAVRSQLARLLEHLLKLAHAPPREPREGWYDTIGDARRELYVKLSPSLRRDVDARLPELYALARRRAALALTRYGAVDAADTLPEACPYSLAQLLGDVWFPMTWHASGPSVQPVAPLVSPIPRILPASSLDIPV